ADFYIETKQDSEAEPLLKRALAITEKIEAAGPQRLTFTLESFEQMLKKLATFYTDRDRYDEAEPLLQRELDIAEKKHGPEHRALIQPLIDLANVSDKGGNQAQAEQSLKRALAIEEKVLRSEGTDFFSPSQALDVAEKFY